MSGVGAGIDSQFGLVNEAVYGTAVTVTRFLEMLSEGITADQAVIESLTLGRGLSMRSGRTKRYTRGAAGAITLPVTNKAFGKVLEQLGAATITWVGGTNAARVLTCDTNPSANDTVTIGSTVYTFKASVTTTAFEVLIGLTLAESLRNLANAINLGPGEGVYYGSLTTIHPTVSATYTATTLTATDKTASGTTANTVATTETFTAAGNAWAGATLTGGVNGTDTEYKITAQPDSRGNRRKTATVQIGRPATNGIIYPFTYTGVKVTAWKLSLATDGWLILELTIDCKGESTAVALATPSYASSASLYDFSQAAVTVDAVAADIISFEFSAALALSTDRRYLGNQKRNPLANGEWVYTGTLAAHFDSLAHQTAWLAQTNSAIVLTLTGSTIPSSSNPFKIVLTLPACEWTGEGPTAGGPDLLSQGRPFKVLDNGADPAWKWEYHTSDTAL